MEIPISSEELAAAQDRAFRHLVQHARVPGFRKGKVPRRIFEAQYGTAGIAERAFDEVIPVAYSRAIEEHDLEPVERPSVELVPEGEGQPLMLKATVAVRPEIELGDYKGLEIAERPQSAGDAEVDETLARLRSDAASLVPVDRPVRIGDVATLDYAGTIDGAAFEGGTATNSQTEIAEGRFIPGFVEGIVGLKPGESKEISATFPADYPKEEVAGKEATFAVTVHDVKERELPELDDEFAKRFRDDATLESLRRDIRERLDAGVARQAREASVSELVDKLIAAHAVPLPAVLVDRELESMVADSKEGASRTGMSWEEYLKTGDTTEEALRERFRDEAERRVKGTLLVEAISRAEHIEATPSEVDAELSDLARRYAQPKEQIRAALRPRMDAIRDGIVRSKTLDFLLEHARVATSAATIPDSQ